MIENRSSPSATVIPVLSYEDVGEASAWLCDVFGFRERLRIGSHRAQLVFGEGAVIVRERGAGQSNDAANATHSVHVRVADANSHYEHARQQGARILQPPTDFPFGERQYTAEDLGGHQWTFSQSIADVDPASWGGTAIDLG
ncbi:MAG: VOC family protein [Nitrososphaerota archaeon]